MLTFNDFLSETYIWGIPTKLEDMSKEDLQKEIDNHIFWINHMTKNASKTDQGFDDNRISLMKDELKTLKNILSKKD